MNDDNKRIPYDNLMSSSRAPEGVRPSIRDPLGSRRMMPLDTTFVDLTGTLDKNTLDYISRVLVDLQRRCTQFWNQDFSLKGEKAWEGYFGRQRGDEKTGFSTIRTREVAQVVDNIASSCLKAVFKQGSLVEFLPDNSMMSKSSDPEMTNNNCRMMGRHISSLIRQHPNALKMFEDFALTGAIEGVAFMRVESYQAPTQAMKYTNKSVEQVAQIEMDPKVQIKQFAQEPDPTFPHGIKFHLTVEVKPPPRTLFQFVPNAAMLWQPNAVSFDQKLPNGTNYIGCMHRLPVSEIVRMYPAAVNVLKTSLGEEAVQYQDWDGREQTFSAETGDLFREGGFYDRSQGGFPSHEIVGMTEEYVKLDLGERGEDQLTRIIRIDNQIVHISQVADNPFVWWSCKAIPGRAVGQSINDKIIDIQDMSTDITRGAMNLIGLTQSPRTLVNISQGNNMANLDGNDTIDDLTEAVVGGIVRVGGPPDQFVQTFSEVHPDTPMQLLTLRDVVRGDIALRTGFGAMSVGQQTGEEGRTATGLHMSQMSASLPKESIIDNYAEGLKLLALKTLSIEISHGLPINIKSEGAWETVDPTEWTMEVSCEIHMSGAIINSDQRLAYLQTLQASCVQVMEHLGVANQVMGLSEYSNIINELVLTMGFNESSRFVNVPTQMQIQEIEQKLAEQAQQDSDMAVKMKELELKETEMMMDIELSYFKVQQEAALEQYKLALDSKNESARISIETQLKMIEMKIEAKLKEKEIAMKSKIESSKLSKPVRSGGKVG